MAQTGTRWEQRFYPVLGARAVAFFGGGEEQGSPVRPSIHLPGYTEGTTRLVMAPCVMRKDCCLWKTVRRDDKGIVTPESALGASGPWKNRTAFEFKCPSIGRDTQMSHNSTDGTRCKPSQHHPLPP